MSEDKRKNARLQGRFSDDIKPARKEKKKLKNDDNSQGESSGNISSNGKNPGLKPSQGVEGFDVKYDENARDVIEQLVEKKKPTELREPGEHLLSDTENGISRVIFEPDFLTKEEADELFTLLHHTTQWYDKNIVIHGKEFPQPRLVAWYGPYPYAYSGALLEPLEMTPKLLDIKDRIEKYLQKWNLSAEFNSVLLNLYRNEKDSVAWHSDDELSLGLNPVIASVSLGEVRRFEMSMKQKVRDRVSNEVATDYTVHLTPGSLIIMDGCMQKDWKHQVPKEYHDKGSRINLTFRTVYSKEESSSQVPLKTSDLNISNSKQESTKHIFDNCNFPPLGGSNTERDSKKSYKSHAKVQSTEVSTTCNDKNSVHQTICSGEEVENSELNSSTNGENVPSQNTDSLSKTASLETENRKELALSAKTEGQNEENKNPSNNIYAEVVSCHLVDELPEQIESSLTLNEVKTESNALNQGSQLNAEATEFVPKFHNVSNNSFAPLNYYKLDIIELADLYLDNKVPYSQFEEFSKALNKRIYDCSDMFLPRDHYELNVLCSINDSNQIENHHRKILQRLCSMIKNADKINRTPRSFPSSYSHHPPARTAYRDNNRPRNINYKGNSYRTKGYKD